jgi:hypothetical protein
MPDNCEIPFSAAAKILNTAAAAGVKAEALCDAAEVDLRILEDVDNQIPFTRLIRLYQCGARLTGDENFGLHVGEQDSPKLYGILGYVTINSQTVGEAINRLIRFQHIRTNAYKFTLEINGSNAHLTYTYQTNDVSVQESRHEAEETLCSIVQFGRMMTGAEWILHEVHFEHDRPENVSEHERIFRAPVYFGKPVTQLIFDSSFLTTPFAEADLILGSLLERQAEELLEKSKTLETSLVNQVRQLIRENLGSGNLGIESICRKLGCSVRTLQRKLKEEGLSYQKLLEEARDCDLRNFLFTRLFSTERFSPGILSLDRYVSESISE